MKLGLVEISVRRPVVAVMLIGALVVMGLVSMPRIDVALFPDVEMPVVTVTTRMPGSTPGAIERSVTEPLEEAINAISGVDRLSSVSAEGFSRIIIGFELEQDIADRAQDVRDKVAAARERLPKEAKTPIVERFDAESEPILSVLLSGPLPIRTLSEMADKRVKQPLERVSGVGNVTLVGDRRREIRIWLDPLRLSGYGLAVDDVLAVLKREHVEVPGGRIETPDTEYVVKMKGKLTTTAHFGALTVAERSGRPIHLRDVAIVEDGMAARRSVSRLNGETGVALRVRRQSGANQVAVAKAVKAEIERIRPQLPDNVSMVIAQDTTIFIERSLDEVRSNLILGGLLAVMVIFAFLRSWRSTLIASLAIPSSLVASFVLIYAFDFTLNNLTLIALSLSIGILIDDAIVVVENVHRHMRPDEPRAEAALRGTHEVGLAVVATTAALCAVFVPIAFMRGIVGQFFTEFGLVVTFAVCTSTLVALTLTPMLCARMLRPEQEAKTGGAYRAMERGYRALETGYRRMLVWSLGNRRIVVGIAFAALFLGIGLAALVPVDFAPASDRGEFNAWIELAPGTPVQQTRDASVQIEQAFRAHPEVRAVFTTIGGGAERRANEATFYVQLTRRGERDVSQHEVMEDLRAAIEAAGLPLLDSSVEYIPWMSIRGGRYHTLSWTLSGPEPARLELYARQIIARMREAGGYQDLGTSYQAGKPEIALDLNRERSADLGVSAAQIGRSISALLGGLEVTSFEEAGERYDVRVQLRPEYRDDPAELGLLNVRAPSGELI
ncbi:MAG: efflux RND transporter permease subunit, partial [Myxococcota bacterium]